MAFWYVTTHAVQRFVERTGFSGENPFGVLTKLLDKAALLDSTDDRLKGYVTRFSDQKVLYVRHRRFGKLVCPVTDDRVMTVCVVIPPLEGKAKPERRKRSRLDRLRRQFIQAREIEEQHEF